MWYPFLLYILWTIPFGAMADTGDCKLKIPTENMLFGVSVNAGAVFIGILLRRYGKKCFRTCMQMVCSAGTVLLLVLGFFVILGRANETVLTPLKIFLGCCCQPVGGLLGFFISKMCGRTNRIAFTIAFETGIQNFTLPLAILALSFHPDSPFLPEMLSTPLLANASYSLWSALMTIICRMIAGKDSQEARGEGGARAQEVDIASHVGTVDLPRLDVELAVQPAVKQAEGSAKVLVVPT